MTHYELWTVPYGNLVGYFESKAEALGLVRTLVDHAKPDDANILLLTAIEDDHSGDTVAEGIDLFRLAYAGATPIAEQTIPALPSR